MTWAPLLLADPSPALRRLVLRDLFTRPEDDPEVREMEVLVETDPLIQHLVGLQSPDGWWGTAYQADIWGAGPVQSTALVLMRLGYLGLPSSHPAVQRGADFLFSQQLPDGSWPLPAVREAEPGQDERRGYDWMPLQTALPLRGLASCGFAEDPRAERAYEWLLAHRLADGAWPTGVAEGGVQGFVAGYRRLPHSRWGCRSNTTGALICLALHPQRRAAPEARRALDLLLGRETREEHALGYEVARLVGAEAAHGFTTFYARFDLALLLDLCARIGASMEDERVRDLAAFVRGLQGTYGLWEYHRRPQVSRWLTFDLLRSLTRLEAAQPGEWQSSEPRTPFHTYGKRQKRF